MRDERQTIAREDSATQLSPAISTIKVYLFGVKRCLSIVWDKYSRRNCDTAPKKKLISILFPSKFAICVKNNYFRRDISAENLSACLSYSVVIHNIFSCVDQTDGHIMVLLFAILFICRRWWQWFYFAFQFWSSRGATRWDDKLHQHQDRAEMETKMT